MDTVYFDGPLAPGGQDWLHCEVQGKRDGVVRVAVTVGYNKTYMEFPLARVQRIEYGKRY